MRGGIKASRFGHFDDPHRGADGSDAGDGDEDGPARVRGRISADLVDDCPVDGGKPLIDLLQACRVVLPEQRDGDRPGTVLRGCAILCKGGACEVQVLERVQDRIPNRAPQGSVARPCAPTWPHPLHPLADRRCVHRREASASVLPSPPFAIVPEPVAHQWLTLRKAPRLTRVHLDDRAFSDLTHSTLPEIKDSTRQVMTDVSGIPRNAMGMSAAASRTSSLRWQGPVGSWTTRVGVGPIHLSKAFSVSRLP